MIDTKELRRLAQAVSGWGNCNQTWLDQSEDVPAVVVGHIGEDGETYPVVTIDCDQYYAADQSLPLGKFYTAANPAAVIEILDRLEAAEKAVAEAYQRGYATGQEEVEKERDALRTKIEAMERQEPVAEIGEQYTLLFAGSGSMTELVKRHGIKIGTKLYALPGAKGETK